MDLFGADSDYRISLTNQSPAKGLARKLVLLTFYWQIAFYFFIYYTRAGKQQSFHFRGPVLKIIRFVKTSWHMVRKSVTPSKWALVIAQNFAACTYHKNRKKDKILLSHGATGVRRVQISNKIDRSTYLALNGLLSSPRTSRCWLAIKIEKEDKILLSQGATGVRRFKFQTKLVAALTSL